MAKNKSKKSNAKSKTNKSNTQKTKSNNTKAIRLPKVMKLTGLSRSTIYRLVKIGEFPKQRKLSERVAVWLKSEIEDFILSK